MTTFSEKMLIKLIDGAMDADGDPVSLRRIDGNVPTSWPHPVALPNGTAYVGSDGGVTYDDGGDTSSHPDAGEIDANGNFTYTLWDGVEESPTYTAVIQLNGAADANTGPTAAGGLSDITLTQNVAMAATDLSVDFSDADGDVLTFSLAPSSAALPAGISLSSAGLLSGTPTVTSVALSIVVRGADGGGLMADSGFSLTVNAASTADQIVTRGANTGSGKGGLQPLASDGSAIPLTTYQGLQSGSLGGLTPSISGGRLTFTGGSGAPDGAIIRCGYAGGTIDLEIAEVPNRVDVASLAEYNALTTTGANYSALSASHIYFQPGNYGAAQLYRRRVPTATNSLMLEGSKSAVFTQWVFDDVWDNVSVSEAEVVTLKGVTVHRNDDPGSPDSVAINLIEYKKSGGSIVLDDVLVQGRDVLNASVINADGGVVKGEHYDGFGWGSPWAWKKVEVKNSHFEGLYKGIKVSGSDGVEVINTTAERVYSDFLNISAVNPGPTGTPPAYILIKDNVFEHHLCLSTDTDNPHGDFVQVFGRTAPNATWQNMVVENNIFASINGRGHPQVIWMDDLENGWFEATVRNNVCISHNTSYGIHAINGKNCTFTNNTVANYNPTDMSYQTSGKIGIWIPVDGGGNTIQRNVADNYIADSTVPITNNVDLGQGGAKIPYATAFAGSNFASPFPTTIAELLSRYRPAPNGPIMAGTVFNPAVDAGCIDQNGNHVKV